LAAGAIATGVCIIFLKGMNSDQNLSGSLSVCEKLFTELSVGIVVLSSDRKVLFSNPGFYAITGYETHEIQDFRHFFFAFCEGEYGVTEKAKRNEDILSDIFSAREQTYSVTVSAVTKYGTRRVIGLQSVPIDNRFVLVLDNEIEGRIDKEDLQWKNDYISSILNSLPDLVLITTIDGVYKDAHAGSPDLLLMPKVNFIGKHYSEVMPGKHTKLLDRAFKKIHAGFKETGIAYQADINGLIRHFDSKMVRLNEFEVVIVIRDVTDVQRALETLERQNELQQLLTKISSTYITIHQRDIEEVINESLDELGKFVQADRFYIFSYDFGKMTASNTYEWCASGIEPQINNLQDVPIQGMDSWIDHHRAGQVMAHHNVQALAMDDPVRQILDPQGIKSIITMPLMEESGCIGFIGLDYVNSYHDFIQYEYLLLTLFSQMFVNMKKRLETERAFHKQNLVLKNIAWSQSHMLRAPVSRLLGITDLLLSDDVDGNLLQPMINSIRLTVGEIDTMIRETTRTIEDIDPERESPSVNRSENQ